MVTLNTEKAEITDLFDKRLAKLKRAFLELELEQMRKGEIEARQRLARAKKAVEDRQTAFERAMSQARTATGNAWQEAKDGLDSAWDELADAVEAAREEFAGAGSGS